MVRRERGAGRAGAPHFSPLVQISIDSGQSEWQKWIRTLGRGLKTEPRAFTTTPLCAARFGLELIEHRLRRQAERNPRPARVSEMLAARRG